MESIFIVTREPYLDVFKKRLAHRVEECVRQHGAVESSGDTLWIAPRMRIVRRDASLYDEGELSDEALSHYYELLYWQLEDCKTILEEACDDSTVLVDNDFGVTLPGDAFVARMRSFPTWDWRRTR